MTTLECAIAGCYECRVKVKAAHGFAHEKPKLHRPAEHAPNFTPNEEGLIRAAMFCVFLGIERDALGLPYHGFCKMERGGTSVEHDLFTPSDEPSTFEPWKKP